MPGTCPGRESAGLVRRLLAEFVTERIVKQYGRLALGKALCYSRRNFAGRLGHMSEENAAQFAVHENLDTAYTNLAALVRYFQNRNFIGRIHVVLDEYEADVTLNGKNPPLVRETDHAKQRTGESEEALRRLFVRASEPGGLISVYESRVSEPGQPMPLRVPGVVPPTPLVQHKPDQPEILTVAGELIAGVERAAVALGVDFDRAFDQARIALADDYGFFDPTVDDFDYKNGLVNLKSNPAS